MKSLFNNNKKEEDEMSFSLETVEKILKIQKFVSYKEGRELSFTETLEYLMEDYVDRENLLDKNHNKKLGRRISGA